MGDNEYPVLILPPRSWVRSPQTSIEPRLIAPPVVLFGLAIIFVIWFAIPKMLETMQEEVSALADLEAGEGEGEGEEIQLGCIGGPEYAISSAGGSNKGKEMESPSVAPSALPKSPMPTYKHTITSPPSPTPNPYVPTDTANRLTGPPESSAVRPGLIRGTGYANAEAGPSGTNRRSTGPRPTENEFLAPPTLATLPRTTFRPGNRISRDSEATWNLGFGQMPLPGESRVGDNRTTLAFLAEDDISGDSSRWNSNYY